MRWCMVGAVYRLRLLPLAAGCFARFTGRGLFHAGDLQARLAQTVGNESASPKRGSHSYPQRSHRKAVTVFLKTAMGTDT